MATEIIGLSHREREIVANVVKYNHQDFDYYEELGTTTTLDTQSYLTIAKLTAILRRQTAWIAATSRSSGFQDDPEEDQLIITVNTAEDITLERGLFEAKASFFEEVFCLHPVIKQKKL
ncbi:MAG: hypothetical protein ACLVAW_08210 [Eisenbergiella massiliensis]